MLGRTLAHYKIVEKIGSGGMGDVYAAEDTKLERKVALKVLPPELAERGRVRFEQEAKAIAALDHPNIVQVFSVEEAEGIHFITMQLVHGKTLTELLPLSGFPLNKFFEIAIPLADAVASAHQEGITHRDLKPDNVMVGADGRPKVLDFGLAKAQQQLNDFGGSELPTRAATQEGHIVGTPTYMSPEQAEGKQIDARTDIFSLGIVFYEMLTGQRPFGGNTPTSVLSSILKDTPRPVSELRPDVPRELARAVHRCLAKGVLDRYQSAIDLRHVLEETKHDIDSGDLLPAQNVHPRSKTLPMLALALFAATAAIWWLIDNDDSSMLEVPRLQNALQVSSSLGVENHPTWSPDGVRLAYEAGKTRYNGGDYDIWVAQLGSGEPVNMTEDNPGDDRRPSWSPDGRQIAFFSDRDGVWGLYTVAAIGGSPRNVLSLPGIRAPDSAPQWSEDGATVAVSVREPDENIVNLLTLSSLETNVIRLPPHEGHIIFDLHWSPDGRHFAYVEGRSGAAETTRLWTLPLSGAGGFPLTDGRTNVWSPTWSADSRKLFYVSNRGGSMDLWQQALAEDGSPAGEPLAVTQGVGIRSAAFSPDGSRLAYARGRWVRNVWRAPILSNRPVTWADATPVTSEQAYIEYVDVSPDGRFLAVSSDRGGNQDLWILPSEGGEMRQLTTDPTPDWAPAWSPDGTEIAFFAYRSGNRDIWVMPSRGGPARQLTFHPAVDNIPMWSPDGKEIAFVSQRTGNNNVWIVDAEGDREPRSVTRGQSTGNFAWSLDGDWLAFSREEKGFYRVTKDGGEPAFFLGGTSPTGTFSKFSPDGQSIYYSVVSGALEDRDLWKISLDDAALSRLTKLAGRRGDIGYAFAAADRYLYFLWAEDVGDIWVMDIASE